MPELVLPPPAQFAEVSYYFFCAIAVVLGAAMVVWGRLIGRPLVMIALGAGGIWLGPLAGELVKTWAGFEIPKPITQLLAAFLLVVGGFLFERVVWALLLSALAVLPTAYFVVAKYWPAIPDSVRPAATQPAADCLAAYLSTGSIQYWQAIIVGYQNFVWPIAFSLGAAFIVPVAVGLFFPRFIRIMMTSLCGSLAVVVAVMLIIGSALPWAWEFIWKHLYIPAAVVLVPAVMGIFMQYRVAMRLDREEKERNEAREKEKQAQEKQAQQIRQ